MNRSLRRGRDRPWRLAAICLLALPLVFAAEPQEPTRHGEPQRIPDPLTTAPVAQAVPPSPVTPRTDLLPFGPAIMVRPGQVVAFTGRTVFDQGPEDGLEVLVSLHGQKLHESLIELDTEDAMRVLAALAIALGEPHGLPPDSLVGLHPRGAMCRVTVRWQGADGAWRGCALAQLVRDRLSDRQLPPLPAVWTGGRIGEYQYPDGTGGTIIRRQPVLAAAGTLIALFDEENGAPLAMPVPDQRDDRRWEANSALMPPSGTPVVVEIAVLPPTLVIAADEVARPDLATRLAAVDPAVLPVVAVQLAAGADRQGDAGLLQAAAAAAMAAHLPLAGVLLPAAALDGR